MKILSNNSSIKQSFEMLLFEYFSLLCFLNEDILTQQFSARRDMKIEKNTKGHLPCDVKSEILSEFSHQIKVSGYKEKFGL